MKPRAPELRHFIEIVQSRTMSLRHEREVKRAILRKLKLRLPAFPSSSLK